MSYNSPSNSVDVLRCIETINAAWRDLDYAIRVMDERYVRVRLLPRVCGIRAVEDMSWEPITSVEIMRWAERLGDKRQ